MYVFIIIYKMLVIIYVLYVFINYNYVCIKKWVIILVLSKI